MEKIYHIPSETPLIGSVSFGLIDRGTNVIQVRPSSSCPLSCIFCSTDAGPCSRKRRTEYQVSLDHLMEWFKGLAQLKGDGIEAHIDTVGDPLVYPHLEELIHRVSAVKEVKIVSMQSHGYLLSERKLDALAAAGLGRLNLSIDSLNPELARMLTATPTYSVEKIINYANYTLNSTSLDLLLAPVWVHPLNDNEMDGLVELAKSLGAGKKGKLMGIQKCEFHSHGRRTKKMKQVSWFTFFRYLRDLGTRHETNLILRPSDFGIRPATALENKYKRGEKIRVRVIGPGWFKGESLAVTRDHNRTVTIIGVELPIGEDLSVRALRTKDNIIVARPG